MKEVIKDLLIRKRETPLDDIIGLIQNSGCKVVSFDIFDTLIKRNIRSPQDVFKILESQFNHHFNKCLPISSIRKKAETRANEKSPDEDVSLDEIYDTIEQLSVEERNWLKKQEIFLEQSLCQKNIRMYDIYDWCLKGGKYSLKEKGKQLLPIYLRSLFAYLTVTTQIQNTPLHQTL